MADNYLEQLAAEWYEYRDYLVKRNIKVGKRPAGGYEGELDIVAFNPATKHLVHIEPSMDADSWSKREKKFSKKFNLGRKYIPTLFKGLDLPSSIEQIALLGFAGKKHRETVGGGKVIVTSELLRQIIFVIRDTSVSYSAIPEHFPILRTLQIVTDYPDDVLEALKGDQI